MREKERGEADWEQEIGSVRSEVKVRDGEKEPEETLTEKKKRRQR